jgi:hypothetical protein
MPKVRSAAARPVLPGRRPRTVGVVGGGKGMLPAPAMKKAKFEERD